MEKLNIFCSYSNCDDLSYVEFENTIASIKEILKDKCAIEIWSFRQNKGGDLWQENIDENLQTADLFISLFSRAFFASKPCRDELDTAIEIMKKGKMHIIPIILSPCGWKDHKEGILKDIQVLPQDGHEVCDKHWQSKEYAWEDIRKQLREKITDILGEKKLLINHEFEKFLQKVEYIDAKGEVTLEKLYVPLKLQSQKQENLLEGTDSYNEVISFGNNKKILICGESFSGKTTFAKKIFKDMYDKGMIPLYIDGINMYKNKSENMFEMAFNEQYNKSYGFYRGQLNTNKVLIIDNWERLSLNQQEKILKDSNGCLGVYCFVQKNEYLNSYYKRKSFSDFEIYFIERCGEKIRRDCIKKWMLLKGIDEDYHQEDKLMRNIDCHFTSGVIPSYPYFIYSHLQLEEDFMPSDMRITQYGHCFQALIVAYLIRSGIKSKNMNYYFNFYSHLAFYFYNQNKDSISKQETFDFILKYNNKDGFHIPTNSPKDFFSTLIGSQYSLLKNTKDDGYFFSLEYIYYFFLGMYFSDNPDSKIIENLCKNIYKRKNSFSLIFTIHHTKEISILEEIIVYAMCQYDGFQEAILDEKETAFMYKTGILLPNKIMDAKKEPEKERERMSNEADDVSVENKELETKMERMAESDVSTRESLNAIKMVEVLGQIVKNRSGSLKKEKLQEIIENAQNLGLRFINRSLQGLQKEYLESLHNSEKRLGEDISDDNIRKMISWLCFLFSAAYLYKITVDISYEGCLDDIEKVCENDPTPAKKIINYISHLRVDSGIRLDNPQNKKLVNNTEKLLDEFRGNTFAEFMIKSTISHYVHTHKVANEHKAKLLSMVNEKKEKKKRHGHSSSFS